MMILHRQIEMGMNKRLRSVRLLAGAVVLGCGLGIGLAAAGATPGASLFGQDLTAPASGGVAASVPSSVTSSFAIARAPRTSQDSLPADAVQSLEASGSLAVHFGVNPALSRLAGTVDGTAVWLVPGSAGSCMWVDGEGAECAPNSFVSSQGLQLVRIPVSGAASSAIGILPDGASVTATNDDGSQAAVSKI